MEQVKAHRIDRIGQKPHRNAQVRSTTEYMRVNQGCSLMRRIAERFPSNRRAECPHANYTKRRRRRFASHGGYALTVWKR